MNASSFTSEKIIRIGNLYDIIPVFNYTVQDYVWAACDADGNSQFVGQKYNDQQVFKVNSTTVNDTICFKHKGVSTIGACDWEIADDSTGGIQFTQGKAAPFMNLSNWDTSNWGQESISSYSSNNKKIIYNFDAGDMQQGIFTLSFSTNNPDIRNWADYNYLEFDIKYNSSFPLRLEIKNNGISIFNDLIKGYSVTIFNSTKWNHIRIPLSGTRDNINFLNFYVNSNEIDPGSYEVYIKNMYLTGPDTKYCGGDRGWISDLDGDKMTCEAAGFGWTGTACCGDDGQETIAGPSHYGGGCYKGQFVRNNNLIWLVIP